MTCTCSQTAATVGAPVIVTGWTAASTEPLVDPFPVPAYPPAEWFTEKPDWLVDDGKIGVDDDGRVAGYFFHAGQCLVHDPAACPKSSPTGYSAFHQQEVVVEDGSLMRVGVIGNTNGHASEFARVDAAQAHYADPDRQLISCRAYDDEVGGFILGALVPHATYGDVALVRRSSLSGDWRPMPAPWWQAHGIQASIVQECEGFDCIGPTLVTRPGLPLVRRFAAAVLGGLGGVQLDSEDIDMTAVPGETITLPSGITITTPAPAGPQPARVAAPPMEAAPPAEAPPDEGGMDARVAALEEQVAALNEAVGQLIDMTSGQMAASVELPPSE